MKILANDGISTSENLLKEAGHEILDNRVSQEHLINLSMKTSRRFIGKKCYINR
jgi:hypothetical protein